MRKLILAILLIFSFCRCKNMAEKSLSEKKQNVSEIVEAVILEDNLNVSKNSSQAEAFCSELKKIRIQVPEKTKDGLLYPPSPKTIYITDLVNDKVNNQIFFSSKDSLYLLAQNSNPEKLKIDKDLNDKLNSTTLEKELLKRKNGQRYRFYEMTIPIFSIDNQKAYVQVDYFCGRLCGGGKSYYLKKIKGYWTIVKKWSTWMS